MTLRNWEREGYRGRHREARARSGSKRPLLRIRTEEHLGSLISAGGVVSAVQEANKGLADWWTFSILPPGRSKFVRSAF